MANIEHIENIMKEVDQLMTDSELDRWEFSMALLVIASQNLYASRKNVYKTEEEICEAINTGKKIAFEIDTL